MCVRDENVTVRDSDPEDGMYACCLCVCLYPENDMHVYAYMTENNMYVSVCIFLCFYTCIHT